VVVRLETTVSDRAKRGRGCRPHLVSVNRTATRNLSRGGSDFYRRPPDEPVVPESEVKALKGRIRELERLLGRKTLENEILKEGIEPAGETTLLSRPPLLKKDDSR